MNNPQILIIGCGPAGSSAALHLAQLAPQLVPEILVLEKASHPRPKLCAGGLVVDAEVILQRLGLDVREVPHTDVRLAHFDYRAHGLAIGIPGRHALRVIRRNEFDAWLAGKVKALGIEFREGVTVKSVHPEDSHVRVETDAGPITARVVIGADGSNGVTRRSILPDAPVHTARLLEVLTPPDAHRAHAEDEAYFDFFCVPEGIAGYVWDFPTRVQGQAMRCWGIYDTNILAGSNRPPLKSPLSAEMARLGLDLEQHELKGHPIRWFSPGNPLSVPRVLLAGDAAGADPLFGEGISMALGYGRAAAEAVLDAFTRDDFSFREYRRSILRSPLGQTLMVRWLISHIVYRLRWRWFQRLFWRHMGWVITPVAWLFVLNWGKRLK